MYNAQFKTMFNLIAIDLMLLLVNFSYELVQQKCSDIASLGPGEWFYAMLKIIPTYIILVLVNLLLNWGKKWSYHKIHVVYNL